jgi:hypothetical protein
MAFLYPSLPVSGQHRLMNDAKTRGLRQTAFGVGNGGFDACIRERREEQVGSANHAIHGRSRSLYAGIPQGAVTDGQVGKARQRSTKPVERKRSSVTDTRMIENGWRVSAPTGVGKKIPPARALTASLPYGSYSAA